MYLKLIQLALELFIHRYTLAIWSTLTQLIGITPAEHVRTK